MASSGQLTSSVRHTHDESRRTAAVLVRFPHPAVDPVYVPHRLQRPNHKHRTRVFRWSVLDLYILPLVAVRPPAAFLLALLFKHVHRLADPRSTHPHTLATQLPRNAASPIQTSCREQCAPRSRHPRPDALDAPRPEERDNFPAQDCGSGFREPGKQPEPCPVPCHLPIIHCPQFSSPAFPRPHRPANASLLKRRRKIYWLSTTSGVVSRITTRSAAAGIACRFRSRARRRRG